MVTVLPVLLHSNNYAGKKVSLLCVHSGAPEYVGNVVGSH